MKVIVCDICGQGVDRTKIDPNIQTVVIRFINGYQDRELDICDKCLSLIAEKSREIEKTKTSQ